jgi:hypothetical protein
MTHGFCPFMSVMEMLAQWRSASAKNYGIAFGMFVLGNAPPRVIPRSAMKLTRSHLAGPNAPAIVRFETDERTSRDVITASEKCQLRHRECKLFKNRQAASWCSPAI